MADYSWIGPLIGGISKAFNSYATGDQANREAQAAYDQMLANLRERFSDYDALGSAGYQDIGAEQMGPSALESIQVDPAGRQGQLEALAALDDLAKNGGLTLADLQALNEIQANLNRNVLARRKGLANDFAARGQLGAGAQLAMDLSAQQDAATNANDRAESVAAQAQSRAMQAILQKAGIGRAVTNDDYSRKSDAARARDAIEARNAAARTDAAKYNNSIKGQAYEDKLAQAKGKTELTKGMNEVIFGKGKQQANTTLAQGGYRNDLIDQAGTAWDKWGKSESSDDKSDDYEDGYSEDDEINQNDDD